VLAHRAAELGRLGVVMFQWRFNPALQALRCLLQDGHLGSVLHVEASFRHDFLSGSRTGWPWRHDVAQAGAGAYADLGVHLLDLLRWLTGHEFVVSAASSAVTWPERIGAGGGLPAMTEDVGVAVLASRPEKFDASLMVSRVAPGRRALRVDITGSAASAVVDIEPEAGTSVLTRWPDRQEQRWGRERWGNPYAAVVARLSGREVPELPEFVDGLAAQRLLDRLVTDAVLPAHGGQDRRADGRVHHVGVDDEAAAARDQLL
jgi:predicted dehydrogenase